MAIVTITGMTATAMQAIRDQTIVSAAVVANHLILTRYNGTTIDAGSVVNMTWTTVSISESTTGPEGVLAANVGSLTMKTNGELWLKVAGAGGNTGWLRIGMPGATPFVVCSSSTRPSSPTVGLPIYETDTGKLLVYYGAVTGWKPPWGQAWGVEARIAKTVGDTTVNTSFGTAVTLGSSVYTANRIYKLTLSGTIGNASGATVVVDTDWYDGGAVISNGTGLSIGNLSRLPLNAVTYWIPGSTVTKTVSARAKSTATLTASTTNGLLGSTAPASLIIEDIGPNGNPPAS